MVNWSYSNDLVRLDVKFGVTYDSDPHKMCELAVAAAQSVERVLKAPPPVCHLTAFGASRSNSAVVLDQGPAPGHQRARAVMLALWDTFEREGIDPDAGADRACSNGASGIDARTAYACRRA